MPVDNAPYTYVAYGTAISSAIPLPGLPARGSVVERTSGTGLRVSVGPLPRNWEDLDDSKVYDDRPDGLCVYRLSDGFGLTYQGIGSLRVRADRITLSPDPAAEQDSIAWLVSNLGLRLALVARGAVVFHASAALVDDVLVSFAGPSGRGKSTLAAACYANGHVHHTDDLVPVQTQSSTGKPLVSPGPPSLRTDSDVASTLGLSSSRQPPEEEPVLIDTSDRHSTVPREIEVLYLIDDADEVSIDPVPTQDAVLEILRRSYALYRDSDADSASTHFEVCGELAQSIRVRRLSRPRSLHELREAVAAIETDLSS